MNVIIYCIFVGRHLKNNAILKHILKNLIKKKKRMKFTKTDDLFPLKSGLWLATASVSDFKLAASRTQNVTITILLSISEK